jgi:plastocyanin
MDTMKNRLHFFVAILILTLALTACGAQQVPASPVLTPPAISVQITKDDCPSLDVQMGMQIAWTNADSVDHMVLIEQKDEQGNVTDSGGTDLLQPGTTFSITLLNPGEYTYYCSKDRKAFGTITVFP